GGPDSVCLAHVLNSLKQEKALELYLAHVNYKLRGEDSELDAKFCRQLAEKLDLPLEVKTADLSGFKDSPGNIQAEARKSRMHFYEEIAEKNNCNKIALGHTLDDNIETILANTFRGCGLAGLSGMPAKSGKIIRPLLNIRKADILDYLDESRISYRIDASNLQSDYTRNKIRNIILPKITDEINPGVYESVARLSRLAFEASEYFEKYAADFIDQYAQYSLQNNIIISLVRFIKLDRILKRYILKKSIQRLVGNIRGITAFDLIDSALDVAVSPTGTRADLGGKLMIEKAAESLIVFKPQSKIEPETATIPGKSVLHSFNIVLNSKLVSKASEVEHSKNNYGVFLDFDKLRGEIEIRQFGEGDYFQPLGMKDAKKLSDFFTDRKIPRALRPETPLLVCKGEIAWVIGHEISELFKLDNSSRKPVKLWAEKVVRNVE
ncbi:MAG: tRNA lysidine(34) synthetase TilS, partial [candidate division Zixibacteria bacterium]|nr:tRNA lysidine(34) synthetase TilS [candidate division Zixibacteria bacterium]